MRTRLSGAGHAARFDLSGDSSRSIPASASESASRASVSISRTRSRLIDRRREISRLAGSPLSPNRSSTTDRSGSGRSIRSAYVLAAQHPSTLSTGSAASGRRRALRCRRSDDCVNDTGSRRLDPPETVTSRSDTQVRRLTPKGLGERSPRWEPPPWMCTCYGCDGRPDPPVGGRSSLRRGSSPYDEVADDGTTSRRNAGSGAISIRATAAASRVDSASAAVNPNRTPGRSSRARRNTARPRSDDGAAQLTR